MLGSNTLPSIMILTFGLYSLVMGVAHRLPGESIIRFIINGLYISLIPEEMF